MFTKNNLDTYEAKTWVGLENPNYVFCKGNSECANQLRWTVDGSTFDQPKFDWFTLDMELINDEQDDGDLQTECIFWYVSIRANFDTLMQ